MYSILRTPCFTRNEMQSRKVIICHLSAKPVLQHQKICISNKSGKYVAGVLWKIVCFSISINYCLTQLSLSVFSLHYLLFNAALAHSLSLARAVFSISINYCLMQLSFTCLLACVHLLACLRALALSLAPSLSSSLSLTLSPSLPPSS